MKALVPGCGKGYDVLLLSAFGYDATGLEISSKALEEARKVRFEKRSNFLWLVGIGISGITRHTYSSNH